MTHTTSLSVYNPSTGALMRTLPRDSAAVAMKKIDRAYEFFQQRAQHLPLHERVARLQQLHQYLQQQRDGFIATMVSEGGKPYRDSVVEFDRACQGIMLAITAVSDHTGSSIPLGYQPSSAQRLATTQVFPRGVVLAFSAFNHPLNLIIHQIIPAFATGCPCVVKPASDTPLSCLMLVEAMHAVGIDENYIQFCLPQNNDIASSMAASDKIAFFSFIGSARVGWMLRARLAPGTRCALEHGGIAPCLVTASADLEKAVPALAKGGFYHAGQVCVSTQRIYVAAEQIEEFIARLREQVAALVVGDASDERTDVGPLIRREEVRRLSEWVDEAIAGGAQCVVGGQAIDEQFFAPTVLLNPPPHAKVSQQEIFGPVVCVYRYEHFRQALAAANHPQFAFQAAIFSQDIDEIMQAFDAVESSALMVNDHTAFRDDVMPFAGLKHSGHGVGGIPHTIDDMQYEKMLVIKK